MSAYALAHLPEHLIVTQRWDQLEAVLTDLQFVDAKCNAGLTFDLVGDYANTMAALPELQEERAQQQQRLESLWQYGADLINYASAIALRWCRAGGG